MYLVHLCQYDSDYWLFFFLYGVYSYAECCTHHFGLWYFHFLNLTLFVSCARTSQDKALQNKCVEVLLKFLSHPLPEIKEQTYSTIKQVVKVSLLCQDLLSIQNKCTTLAHNLSRILEVLVKNCNKCLYFALFIDQFDKNQEGFETCTPKEYCPFINVYLFVDTIIAQACVDSWWIILIVYLFFRAPSM